VSRSKEELREIAAEHDVLKKILRERCGPLHRVTLYPDMRLLHYDRDEVVPETTTVEYVLFELRVEHHAIRSYGSLYVNGDQITDPVEVWL
jgi:hypothetical protein